MQYNTFRQAEGIPMVTTFCTNHVRQAGLGLAEWMRKGDTAYFRKSLRHGGMLLMFVTGAVMGTILCGLFAGRVVWGASCMLFIVFADLLHADLMKEKGMLGRVPAGH